MRMKWSYIFLASIAIVGIFFGQSQAASQPGSKIVNISFGENTSSLDPHHQQQLTGTNAVSAVFEGLVHEDREGGYYPRLAERWEHNEAGDTWRFFLRKGVKFHNGEPFDASDVKATFDRLQAGKGRLLTAVSRWNTLVSFTVIDDYAVEFVFDGPNPRCLTNLANTFIIPDEAYAQYGDDLWNKQMMYGTGPWLFEQWVDGQYIHLLKNPDYWNKAEYDPYYEEVYIRVILERATAVAAHLAGDIQANLPQSGVAKELRVLYEGTGDRIQEIVRQTGQMMYVQFECAPDRVFSDKNARMAFEYCIDRKAIIDNVLDGDGEVITSVITPPVEGFDPTLEPYVYDPDLAKEYLAKSTYDGRKMTIITNTAIKKGEDVLLAIAGYMNAVGFNCDISVLESAVFTERRATGNYDLLYTLGSQNNNDATEYLTQRVYTNAHGHNYVNQEMNGLIEKVVREMDAAKRASDVTRISHIMREEAAPATGICSVTQTFYVDWGVTGIYYFPDGSFRMMYVDYDPSLLPQK